MVIAQEVINKERQKITANVLFDKELIVGTC